MVNKLAGCVPLFSCAARFGKTGLDLKRSNLQVLDTEAVEFDEILPFFIFVFDFFFGRLGKTTVEDVSEIGFVVFATFSSIDVALLVFRALLCRTSATELMWLCLSVIKEDPLED